MIPHFRLFPTPLPIPSRVVALLLAAALCGCSGQQGSNVESGRRDQVLHFGNGDEPQELDPHVVTGIPEWHIIMALFEGLVSKHPADLSIQPGVAESWDISEDRRTYTFHLRADARWSNGDPVTAGDFAYSWRRALTPGLGNPYAYMLYYIRNAEAFVQGKVDFAEVGVRVLDDRTLQVELVSATPFFLQLLDHHSYYPVNPRVIEHFGAIDERGTRWTRPGNFVGNGAFTLKQWILNRIVVVEKNPAYWDAGRVRLNQVHFYPVPNTSTEERMFRAGQLHITDRVPADKIAVYRQNDPASLHITPYLGIYFYRFNTSVWPLGDVRVRKALAMCIDREAIVGHITKGGQLPAYTLTPPDTAGYTSHARVPYDPVAARALLAEAGFPDGRGFPRLELMFNTDEGHRKIATAIQEMWKKALNVEIAIANQDWKVYMDRETNRHYQMSRAAWIGDYVDPTTFLDMFMTGGGNNRTGWSNARYDELLLQAARTAEQSERYALLAAAEKILMDEVPIIPIYVYTQVRLISPDLRGWEHNILDQHPYKYLWLDDSGHARTADGH